MFRVLHLSDLHYGADHYFSRVADGKGATLAESVRDAVDGQVDALILSGDFFSKDQIEDLGRTDKDLSKLKEYFGLAPGQVMFVPGNHDVNWGITERFESYDRLVRLLESKEMVHDALPAIKTWDLDDKRQLVFVLLSSCIIEGPMTNGLGFVGGKQIIELKKRLKPIQENKKQHAFFAVLHHHLLPVNNQDVWDKKTHDEGKLRGSLTLDAPSVLKTLSDLGFTAVFHGHQHENVVVRFEYVSRGTRPLLIFAAGSAGAKPPEANQRQFYLFEIENDTFCARSFKSEDSAFREVKCERLCFPISFAEQAVSPASDCPVALTLAVPELRPLKDIRFDEPDRSNLVYLFLTAKNTVKARTEIRETIRKLRHEKLWAPYKEVKVQLEGMYDVMGRWDIALRLRVGSSDTQQEAIGTLFDLIGANLLNAKLLSSHLSVPWINLPRLLSEYSRADELLQLPQLKAIRTRHRKAGDVAQNPKKKSSGVQHAPWLEWEDNPQLYKLNRFINVLHEVRVRKTASPRPAMGDGDHRDFYEKNRCQRAFVCVRLPEDKKPQDQKKQELIKDLHDQLFPESPSEPAAGDPTAKDRAAAQQIIDVIAVANDAVVIEVFMKCSQALSINALNRLLERWLPEHETRNYSLMCFDYEEKLETSF